MCMGVCVSCRARPMCAWVGVLCRARPMCGGAWVGVRSSKNSFS